jgi:NADPH:quinone reductase-like Zn-dependent oxidoreductase
MSPLHWLRYQPDLPASPGGEGVGVVEAVGDHVKDIVVGIRVIFIHCWNLWREQVVCKANQVVPVPDGFSSEAAAVGYTNPLTAWALTRSSHDLKEGDWLLQTAAASSVGKLVLQLAGIYGFRTINVIRRREQEDIIRSLGMEPSQAIDRPILGSSRCQSSARSLSIPPLRSVGGG